METPERFLPEPLLQRASLRGNEYAWPIEDIPLVIEAASRANRASLGGQLQFRLPDGETCECYWVEISTPAPEKTATWDEVVKQSAKTTAQEWKSLLARTDFAAEGRRTFAEVDSFVRDGGYLNEIMCFVWYVADPES